MVDGSRIADDGSRVAERAVRDGEGDPQAQALAEEALAEEARAARARRDPQAQELAEEALAAIAAARDEAMRDVARAAQAAKDDAARELLRCSEEVVELWAGVEEGIMALRRSALDEVDAARQESVAELQARCEKSLEDFRQKRESSIGYMAQSCTAMLRSLTEAQREATAGEVATESDVPDIPVATVESKSESQAEERKADEPTAAPAAELVVSDPAAEASEAEREAHRSVFARMAAKLANPKDREGAAAEASPSVAEVSDKASNAAADFFAEGSVRELDLGEREAAERLDVRGKMALVGGVAGLVALCVAVGMGAYALNHQKASDPLEGSFLASGVNVIKSEDATAGEGGAGAADSAADSADAEGSAGTGGGSASAGSSSSQGANADDAAEQVVYTYRLDAADGSEVSMTETVTTGSDGLCSSTTMQGRFLTEDAAQDFLDSVKLSYGSNCKQATRDGAQVTVVIDITSLEMTQEAYEDALRANAKTLTTRK